MIALERARGFTLLELMVAMVVFSVLLLLLYDGLHAVAKTSNVVELRAEDIDNVVAVHRLLRREFAQFQPINIRDESGALLPVFSGKARSVRWVAPLPVHRGGHALYWLVLSADGESPPFALTLNYTPIDLLPANAPGDDSANAPTTLLTDVAEIEFQYRQASTPLRPEIWLREWTRPTESPLAVRLLVQRQSDVATSEWLFPIHARAVAARQTLSPADDPSER